MASQLFFPAAFLAVIAPAILVTPAAAAPGSAAAAVPAAVAPRLDAAATSPHAVAGSLRRIAARQAASTPVRRFDLVGASWPTAAPPAGRIEVRVHRDSGWSSWHRLAADDTGPNAGSDDAATAHRDRRTSTAPLWVGNADRVASRMLVAGQVRRAPADIRLILVNGGSSPADAHLDAIRAATDRALAAKPSKKSETSKPFIYTRRDWGADEKLRQRNKSAGCGKPKYGSAVKVAFVHHTDTPNGYSRAEVPAIIRSIYRYHVLGHGWCDIGYNFLVDRFGRIWQGRYGGETKAVIGAQAGGFNVDSMGVAMIGTFNSVAPNAAMRHAVERLLAWRLAAEYRNPLGRETLLSNHFDGSRYRAHRHISFRVISGHRNADYTDCPGRLGYAALPGIRRAVLARIGAGLVDPKATGTATFRTGSVATAAIRATALRAERWRLDVVSATGAVVDSQTGSAGKGTTILARWNGVTDSPGDSPAPAGTYQLVLTPMRGSTSGVPYRRAVTVTAPVTITGPATTSYGATVTLHGVTSPGVAVTVNVSGQPTATVTASANGTWRSSYVATANASWSATVTVGGSSYTTPAGTTRVVPVVTSPAPRDGIIAAPATTFTLQGTALPLALSVTIMHDGVVIGSAFVGGDGSWSTTVTVTSRETITVVASGGASSPTYTVVPP